MKKVSLRSGFMILLGFLFILMNQSSLQAKTSKKMAILPFTMNSDRDLSFLQDGIMDMLASRLAWKGEVELLEKGIVKKAAEKYGRSFDINKAIEIGKELKVGYVIIGSLTVFGESVSIDAKIVDVANSEELVTAFNQSKGMDDVIPTVNQFAQDINEKIMGRYTPTRTYAGRGDERSSPLMGADEHLKGDVVSYVRRFNVEIISMDAGDIDGDDQNELVFIDKTTLYVYKWVQNTLVKIAEIKNGIRAPNYIWVSIGDINGNGFEEIYVSNLGAEVASSVVYEWDGKSFKKIIQDLPWLIRVIDSPVRGKILIGQKLQVSDFYFGDILTMKWEGKQLMLKEALNLPKKANIFNFAFFKAEDVGNPGTVLFERFDDLELYDQGGGRLWRSGDPFGGTMTSIERYIYSEGADEMFRYLPSPIYLTDLDNNGESEVMVCKNKSKTSRITERARMYTSGRVHFLAWDKAGLNTKWMSPKISGMISGYRVSDLNNDGKPELIIASVQRFDILFYGKPKSQIVIYELEQ